MTTAEYDEGKQLYEALMSSSVTVLEHAHRHAVRQLQLARIDQRTYEVMLLRLKALGLRP